MVQEDCSQRAFDGGADRRYYVATAHYGTDRLMTSPPTRAGSNFSWRLRRQAATARDREADEATSMCSGPGMSCA